MSDAERDREAFKSYVNEFLTRFASIPNKHSRGIIDAIHHIWAPPIEDDFADNQKYKDAVAFVRNFQACDGVDYTLVVPYAREVLSRCIETDRLWMRRPIQLSTILGEDQPC